MTMHDHFLTLLETTCATTVALALVLLLRRPLRVWFGARVAYASWIMVPLAMAAVMLPARVVRIVDTGNDMATIGVPAAFASVGVPNDPASMVLALWLSGAIAFAIWNAYLQRRFVRGLGVLDMLDDGIVRASTCDGLPAVIGLRARIVVPSDFETRFGVIERILILAHERIHIERHDVLCNIVATLLCGLYWFNPLFWLAASRFRQDQELACDQLVVARNPGTRRQYGEAMMKTQVSNWSAPVACQWRVDHPLKERIMMLNRSFPTSRRVAAGMVLVVVVAIASGVAAWAAQPPSYAVASTMDKPTTGEVISIRENNQPVRDVALRAAALAGMRIADPGVLPANKPVTLDFKSISIDTVMKIIADESGLEYKREGDVVRFVADKKSGQPSSPPAPQGSDG